jgi:aspartate dehydrogenase
VKLAIAGLGAIGLPVARRVDAGDVPGLVLVAVSVRDEAKARKAMAGFRRPRRCSASRRWRMRPM